jgi:SAM-dependent methyltransferase
MDYDLTEIPSGYDRARDHGPEFLALWMRALEPYLQPGNVSRILDLGCGTGRFADALSVHFDTVVVGVDPSVKMLERARGKPRQGCVEYHVGSAESIPLPPKSVDAVFVSMAFHHFADRPVAARECRRVLRDRGMVCIRTGTRERIDSYPYVPFFPSTPVQLVELLPDRASLCAHFEAAGFALVAIDVITQTIAESWDLYADKLAAGGDSVLATLSEEAFASGLAAMRRHAKTLATGPVVEDIDLFVFR